MNTYYKYVPNVFLAKCPEKHEKGEIIEVLTRHDRANESVVFNLIFQKDGFYFYSIVRADGFDRQAWANRRADRLLSAAANAKAKSESYYQASNKDSDFLSLGEPIKVGHHSEKRHRRAIEQAWSNMGKSVEQSEKAEDYSARAAYWEKRASEINLSMPESIDFYTHEVERLKLRHEGLKDGTIRREHSFSLTYAKKDLNEAEKKLKLAKLLWGETAV